LHEIDSDFPLLQREIDYKVESVLRSRAMFMISRLHTQDFSGFRKILCVCIWDSETLKWASDSISTPKLRSACNESQSLIRKFRLHRRNLNQALSARIWREIFPESSN